MITPDTSKSGSPFRCATFLFGRLWPAHSAMSTRLSRREMALWGQGGEHSVTHTEKRSSMFTTSDPSFGKASVALAATWKVHAALATRGGGAGPCTGYSETEGSTSQDKQLVSCKVQPGNERGPLAREAKQCLQATGRMSMVARPIATTQWRTCSGPVHREFGRPGHPGGESIAASTDYSAMHQTRISVIGSTGTIAHTMETVTNRRARSQLKHSDQDNVFVARSGTGLRWRRVAGGIATEHPYFSIIPHKLAFIAESSSNSFR